MDLPPEVRTRIHSLAFLANINKRPYIKHDDGLDHHAHDCTTACYEAYIGEYHCERSERQIEMFEQKTKNLTAFRLHPLTQVSRQLRMESLPLFLGESNFEIYLVSNFVDRARTRRGDSVTTPPAQLKEIGVLGMRAELKTRLRSFKSAALFQDVTFNAAASDWPVAHDTMHTVVYVRITFLGRIGIRISSWDGPDMWKYAFRRAGVDATVEALRHVAEGIGKRADFRGFTLKDLEDIARTFRFKSG